MRYMTSLIYLIEVTNHPAYNSELTPYFYLLPIVKPTNSKKPNL